MNEWKDKYEEQLNKQLWDDVNKVIAEATTENKPKDKVYCFDCEWCREVKDSFGDKRAGCINPNNIRPTPSPFIRNSPTWSGCNTNHKYGRVNAEAISATVIKKNGFVFFFPRSKTNLINKKTIGTSTIVVKSNENKNFVS